MCSLQLYLTSIYNTIYKRKCVPKAMYSEKKLDPGVKRLKSTPVRSWVSP